MATTHTIAVCSYNMAATIEESLRSMLDQIEDEAGFELLVVDDSTDRTPRILDRLTDAYDSLRVVRGDNDNLAEARNQSFREAGGEYVLESLDVDDQYGEGILDFVTVYHQLESQLDFRFFLKGKSINMAPRQLLLEVPYRSMGYGEDRDLWRRLFLREAILWLDHEQFSRPIGYEPEFRDRLRISFDMKVADFRSGITLASYLRWCFDAPRVQKILYYLTLALPAYAVALVRGRYGIASPFDRMGALEERIDEQSKTFTEIEHAYDVTIDRTELSDRGYEIFYENV